MLISGTGEQEIATIRCFVLISGEPSMTRIRKYTAVLLSISTLFLALHSSLLQADMIPTRAAFEAQSGEISRQDLLDLIQRQEVQGKLQALGIDHRSALERVSSMTDQELAHMNAQIGDMPAGAGVLEVAVIVLLTLVFLDIFGVTDIFTFIKPAK